MPRSKPCVPVSERALLARINRHLAADSSLLVKKARGQMARKDLGEYFLLDLDRNEIKSARLDLEAYGRRLGVLEPYEALICE